ncbi:MAG: RNase III inhibitor, partial [Firmicutes bacterium]|nr:RNase III inhibitor [Bacillota bacterium]
LRSEADIHEKQVIEQAEFFKASYDIESSCAPCASAPSPTQKKSRSLKDLLKHREETFSQMLLRLIEEEGLTDAEAYKRAHIDRRLFSKIRNNKDYTPSKNTVISFAVALGLNLDRTKDLLNAAGYSLSHSNVSDIIVEYFIINEIYDIFEINETLFHFNQKILG